MRRPQSSDGSGSVAMQPVARRGVGVGVRAAVTLLVAACALAGEARADDKPGVDAELTTRWAEAPDSVGVVGGVTFEGAPTFGLAGRFALTERFALDGQLRKRVLRTDADHAVVGNLGLAWTITYGHLDWTFGDRPSYPLRLDLIGGAAVLDGDLALALGVALRARVSQYVTVEVALRDEFSRGRPHVPPGARGDEPWIQTPLFDHSPEVQIAISLTAPHATPLN
jgi:hypothetical protein